jgi:hypothetical protein
MSDDEYNKSKCSIELNVPNFDGSISADGVSECLKDMATGLITVVEKVEKPIHR